MTHCKTQLLFVLILALVLSQSADAERFKLSSPKKDLQLKITYDHDTGSVRYGVNSRHKAIITDSPVGITADIADFTEGMQLIAVKDSAIDETYALPQGKVSAYHNKANEKTLVLEKNGRKLEIVFRVYDDGIAFRYVIHGSGNIEISKEASGFRLAGNPEYWGQTHPNNYGYESKLGSLKSPKKASLALLCELKGEKHWVLLAQAATYGTYCIPHLTMDDAVPNLLRFTLPLDQKGPVKTTLPFESPWRVAVISPKNLARIVEQTLFENLNPPTEPELVNAAWIKPGRTSWDWFVTKEEKKDWIKWIDFIDEIGWEYHLFDDGWEGYVSNPAEAVQYAESKGKSIMVWQSTGSIDTPEKAEEILANHAKRGFKGVKVDFFDRLPNNKTTNDYEDTQAGIKVRDEISRIAAEHHLQVVFHGCAIPSGERRRWPHILGTEAIHGQEGNPTVEHDNCIAYVRNPLGPVDYSPVWFGRRDKPDAYQLATSVMFDSGFLIFADLHKNYLEHPSRKFLSEIPSSWDEIKFIEGYPASHTVIARRKGMRWYVAGMTVENRAVDLKFNFLENGVTYSATCFVDQEADPKLQIFNKEITAKGSMKVLMIDKGGFVLCLKPEDHN